MTGTKLRVMLAAAALLVGGALWWFAGRDQNPDRPAPGAGRSEAQDRDRAATMIRGLPAALVAGDATALSASLRADGLDLAKALPAGAIVEPDPTSWHRTGAVASMGATVTVPGEEPRRFMVVTVLEDGTWKLSGTYTAAAS